MNTKANRGEKEITLSREEEQKNKFKAEKLSFRFVSERIFLITAHVLKRYQH